MQVGSALHASLLGCEAVDQARASGDVAGQPPPTLTLQWRCGNGDAGVIAGGIMAVLTRVAGT